MAVELWSITPCAEKHLEKCARICYDSLNKITEKSYEKFLHSVISLGHVAILSHASATFYISGISRACSHQLVRHAHLRYLQRSQRYCQELGQDAYILPDKISSCTKLDGCDVDGHSALDLWEDIVWTSREYYKRLIEMGIPAEDARYILLNACPTEIVVSGTLQAWYDFLRLRLTKHAQWEIRNVAKEIYYILNKECPHIFTKELLEKQTKIELDIE